MRPVLCYGGVLRFFKTLQSFDQITTLTYVLIDNFLSLFLSIFIIVRRDKWLSMVEKNDQRNNQTIYFPLGAKYR